MGATEQDAYSSQIVKALTSIDIGQSSILSMLRQIIDRLEAVERDIRKSGSSDEISREIRLLQDDIERISKMLKELCDDPVSKKYIDEARKEGLDDLSKLVKSAVKSVLEIEAAHKKENRWWWNKWFGMAAVLVTVFGPMAVNFVVSRMNITRVEAQMDENKRTMQKDNEELLTQIRVLVGTNNYRQGR